MTTFSDIAANISGVDHVRHAVLTIVGTSPPPLSYANGIDTRWGFANSGDLYTTTPNNQAHITYEYVDAFPHQSTVLVATNHLNQIAAAITARMAA